MMGIPILLFYGFSFVGIVHSVIYSIWAIKYRRIADFFITLFLLAQSLIILQYVFFWTGLEQHYHQLCSLDTTILFLFGPLLFTYVDFSLSERKRSMTYFLHFIPAMVVFLFMLPYYFSTADLKLNHYKMIKYFVLDLRYVVYLIMAHMSVYFFIILYKILKERRVGYIKNWLLTLVLLFGVYIACYISYYVMVRYPWFTLSTDYFVSVGMCASIVSIIFFAYGKNKVLDGFPVYEAIRFENSYFSGKENNAVKKKEPAVVSVYPGEMLMIQSKEKEVPPEEAVNEPEDQPGKRVPSAKYKNSGLTTDAGHELAEALKMLMQKEKLYRESELKLETLAARLGVAKHYVSQIINQHFGVNFFEYINILRIDEAKQLLMATDKRSMNIIEVAYTVGYNTKNTFNMAFRRIVGVTPTEYRNQNQIRMN